MIETDRWESEPPCVRQACHTLPNEEWGYSTRRHMLEPMRPEAVLPDRALCLPTFSHFLIVNKTSISFSFFLSLSCHMTLHAKNELVLISIYLSRSPVYCVTVYQLRPCRPLPQYRRMT